MKYSLNAILCALVSLPTFVTAQGPQSQGPSQQVSEAAYPDSEEGLEKLLQDTVEAVQEKDNPKESALIRSLIMPQGSTWFKDEFGPAFGPRLEAAYLRAAPTLEEKMQTVFQGNVERSWLKPKIFRYTDAATVDSTTHNYLNCMDTVVPLYKTGFDAKGTAATFKPGRGVIAGDLPGYYVYTKGGFRFIPEQVFSLLPPQRPIRIPLDWKLMRSKVMSETEPGIIPTETVIALAQLHKPIFGPVVIRFVVDTGGKLKEITVVEGSPDFSEAYLEVIRQWTFEPTILDGEPVEVEVTLETGFVRQAKQ